MYNEDQARTFLGRMFGNIDRQYFEIFAKNDDEHKSLFFELPLDMDDVLGTIEELTGKYHVWYGVNPRPRKKRKQDEIEIVNAFFADLDAKDFGGGKRQIYEELQEFDLQPSVIIDSGNGYHAYWKLKQPWDVSDDDEREKAISLSERLHHVLNADSTKNLDRVLRVPGTVNIKHPEYNNPESPHYHSCTDNPSHWVPCKIENLSFNNYTTSDLEEVLPEEVKVEVDDTVSVDKPELIEDMDDLRKHVPSHVLERAQTIPAKYQDDRSSNDFWIARKLYESGLTDADVYQCFCLFKEQEWDAGEKFAERGDDYLIDYTLPNAKESSNRFEKLLARIKNAPEGKQLQIADDIYPVIAEMSPAKKDHALQQLQDALDTKIRKKALRDEVKNSSRDQKFNQVRMAKNILDDYHFLYTADKLHVYQNGVYIPGGKEILEREIQDRLGETLWTPQRSDAIKRWIKERCYVSSKDVGHASHLVNVKNGMYDLHTQTLKEHDPRHHSLTQMNVEYDPEAECKRLDQFIDEVFPSNMRDLVWEHAGYLLISDIELKKYLVLKGPAHSGKSTWLNIITECLGKENVAHEALQDLATDRFSKAQLFGKIANIANDLPSRAIDYGGVIKQITGGDRVEAQFKFGQKFYFDTTRIRLLFSCNQLPPVHDYDEAFFDRIHIVECPNQFTGEERDPRLQTKLTTDEARSAWLNRAIDGAQKLLNEMEFSEPREVRKARHQYRLQCDSVSNFVARHTKQEEGTYIPKQRMFQAYVNWCEATGRSSCSKQKFGSRAQDAPWHFQEARPEIDGERVYCWKGVDLTDKAKEKYVNIRVKST